MDWRECVLIAENYNVRDRFTFPENGLAGINCDEGVSLSDITGGLAWLWTYPGDYMLRATPLREFFELQVDHTGGTLSTVIGTMVFIGFLVVFGIASEVIGSIASSLTKRRK